MEETIAVVGIFGLIPFVVWVTFYFRSRAHARTTALIDKLIDRGETITPEIVQTLGIRAGTAHGDLKTGMILVAVGAAVITFGQVIPEDEAGTVMAGIAMFPMLVGIAYIAFWYFFGRKAIKA